MRTRNRRNYWGSDNELTACILMGAVIAGFIANGIRSQK